MNLLDAPVALRDRRARRSRAALLAAAVTLVRGRGSTAISLSELAEAAGLSRQAVYQQFPDRDAVLLEAALDLARRELVPVLLEGVTGADHAGTDPVDGTSRGGTDRDRADQGGTDRGGVDRERVLATVTFFAGHRDFFRPMLTGPCAYPLRVALTELFTPFNRLLVAARFGDELPPARAGDLTAFLTGGAAALIDHWLIDGPDPLDPHEFTDRVLEIFPLIMPGGPAAGR